MPSVAKITADDIRALIGWVKDEKERGQNEEIRQQNEQDRVTAEQGRVTAEQSRVTAEQGRVSAEEDRVTAEASRATLDSHRVHRGEYSAATAYLRNNEVRYGGSTWRALRNVTGVTPVEGLDWTMVAQRGLDGEGSVRSVNNKSADPDGNVTLTVEDIGAETPTGAQSKASEAEGNAKDYADGIVGPVAQEVQDLGSMVDNHLIDYTRHPGYGTTGGTATDYTLTLDPPLPELVEWVGAIIKPHVASGANPTLNIDGKGAAPVKTLEGDPAELIQGGLYAVRYDGSSFILLGEGGGEARVDFINVILGPRAVASKITKLQRELSVARTSLAATTVGDYALFAGGGSTNGTVVDAFDRSLTRVTPTALSVARPAPAATTVGDYALFGGGGTSSATHNVVDAYDTSLTRTTPATLSNSRASLAATTVGDYALFGGGYVSGTTNSNVVNAYDTSLTRTQPTLLSQARGGLSAATIGDYGLFAGGNTGSGSDVPSGVVNAYNTSLTMSTPTSLSESRMSLGGTTVGNYALFGGGFRGTTSYSMVVDAYNRSLTRTVPQDLGVLRANPAAVNIGNFALFAGGNGGSATNAVAAYDETLTRTTPAGLTGSRSSPAATRLGDYGLIGGGLGSGNGNVVDAYADYAETYELFASPGSKYDFGSGEQVATGPLTITVDQPITGYIKYKKGVIAG